jgi:hypothetical protein
MSVLPIDGEPDLPSESSGRESQPETEVKKQQAEAEKAEMSGETSESVTEEVAVDDVETSVETLLTSPGLVTRETRALQKEQERRREDERKVHELQREKERERILASLPIAPKVVPAETTPYRSPATMEDPQARVRLATVTASVSRAPPLWAPASTSGNEGTNRQPESSRYGSVQTIATERTRLQQESQRRRSSEHQAQERIDRMTAEVQQTQQDLVDARDRADTFAQ